MQLIWLHSVWIIYEVRAEIHNLFFIYYKSIYIQIIQV